MNAIRAATQADAARCAEIYSPFVTDSWISFELDPPGEGEMAKRIDDYGNTHGWVVLEVEKQIAGYAYGSPHRTRRAYQSSCDVAVYVDPTYARRGIGCALYTALLPLLGERGYHASYAGIALPNAGSIALHQAMGFTLVGIYKEVGWKMGGWRDVSWWQRLL
jgi:L-amino acid N-acyltransferase YncA